MCNVHDWGGHCTVLEIMLATTLTPRSPREEPFLPLARVVQFPSAVESSARERALGRFVNELSPASGPEFFELLVEFIAECLGFEGAVVAELPQGADGQLEPIAIYPDNAASSEVMRSLIVTHCEHLVETGFSRLADITTEASFDIPLKGADGR